jgi:hypothetical protein
MLADPMGDTPRRVGAEPEESPSIPPLKASRIGRVRAAIGGARSGPWELGILVLVVLGLTMGLVTMLELTRYGTYIIVKGYSAQTTYFDTRGTRLGNLSQVAGAFFIGGAGLLALMTGGARRGWQVPALLIGVIAAVSGVWVVLELGNRSPSEVVNDTNSPFMWVAALGVFAGMRPRVWAWMDRWVYVLAGCYLGFCFVTLYRLGMFVPVMGNDPMRMGLAAGIWFSFYGLFTDTERGNRWVFLGDALLLVCLVLSVFSQSRGWILQCLMGGAVRWLFLQRIKRSGSNVGRWAFGLLGLAVVFGLGVWILTTQMQDAIDALFVRMGRDTRSYQYREYFEFVEPVWLLFGYGPQGTYTYDEAGNPYGSIDNQFLWMALKFGVFVVLAYVALVFVPAGRVLLRRRLGGMKAPGYVLLLWALSMGGVSVYAGLGYLPAPYFMFLLAGRCRWMLANPAGGRPAELRRAQPPARGRFRARSRWGKPVAGGAEGPTGVSPGLFRMVGSGLARRPAGPFTSAAPSSV